MTRGPAVYRVLIATSLAVGGAVAAPVPKGPPPPNPKTGVMLDMAVAKSLGDGMLEVRGFRVITEYVPVTETLTVGGHRVQSTRLDSKIKQERMTYRVRAEWLKATTVDGKELDADVLAKKLGDGGPVVRAETGYDPEWRKVFADDVVFLVSEVPWNLLPVLPPPVAK